MLKENLSYEELLNYIESQFDFKYNVKLALKQELKNIEEAGGEQFIFIMNDGVNKNIEKRFSIEINNISIAEVSWTTTYNVEEL